MSLVDDIARLTIEAGRARAQGQATSGQIWGQTLSNLGQTIAQIPQQIQQQKQAQQETAMRAQEMQIRQKQIDDMKALDTAFTQPGGRDAIINSLPGHLRPAVSEQFSKMDEAHDKATELREKANEAQANSLGRGAAMIRAFDYEPIAAQGVISNYKQKYASDPQMLDQIKKVEAAIQGNPDKAFIKSVVDPIIEASPEQKKLQTEAETAAARKQTADTSAARLQAEAPALAARNTIAQNQAAGTEPITPYQQQMVANQRADNARADAAQAELIKHHRVMEARPVGGAAAGAEGLTPDAVQYTAAAYRMLGTRAIPTRISGPDRAKILNEAANQSKAIGQSPAAVVTKQLAVKADAAALQQLQKMDSSADAFESKALQQADMIADLSAKVPRTKFPIINNALQSGRTTIMGDENATKLANAVETFSEEYAKLMNGSTGSAAAASDSARAAAKRLINTGLSQGTMTGVLEQMKKEMNFTRQGYDAAKTHVTDRIQGGVSAPAVVAPGKPSLVYDPITGTVKPKS